MIIAIEALIGTGKTTLTNSLCDKHGYTRFLEPVESNPYLEKYYKDPHRWSYTMQTHLLWERYKMFQEAYFRSLKGETCVLDRSPQGDYAFALVQKHDGFFTDDEFKSYTNMCNVMHNCMADSDLVIWLELSPEKTQERIQKRSRGCESNIPIEYLHHLYEAYQKVLESLERRTKVVRVDASVSADDVLSTVKRIINENRV